MNPYIIELTPFTVAGRIMRFKMPEVKHTSDIPVFWDNEISGNILLNDTKKYFVNSRHSEISMCYDVDERSGEFIYFLGRGADSAIDRENMPSDFINFDISGLYAIFSTKPTEQNNEYIQTIKETWKYVLMKWLPISEFEYDESRKDFEYYDNRDHGQYFNGKKQMDIYIPICQSKEAFIKAQERETIFNDQRYMFVTTT